MFEKLEILKQISQLWKILKLVKLQILKRVLHKRSASYVYI